MSIYEKLFGAFKPQQAQPPVVPTNNLQQVAPTMQTAQTPGTAPNGVIPVGAANPPPAPAPEPLDKYKELWQPPEPPKEGEQQNQAAPVDPQKLMEAASKVDFSKVMDAESLAKITAGGEEAAAALVTLLNRTAQQVYGQSAVTTAKIVEQAVSQAEERFASQLPKTMRAQNARDTVFQNNAAFNNPAIAPLIEAQVSQLALKFPKATPSELEGMAKEYLTGMANLINPPKSDASTKTAQKEDWSDYS